MELFIDVPWLLECQEKRIPQHPEIHDYTALVAAVARHRVNTPRIGYEVDASWRAAVLLHEIACVRPLPARNAFFAAGVAWSYMAASGQGIDAPYGVLVETVKDARSGAADVYEIADRIRSWRI